MEKYIVLAASHSFSIKINIVIVAADDSDMGHWPEDLQKNIEARLCTRYHLSLFLALVLDMDIYL